MSHTDRVHKLLAAARRGEEGALDEVFRIVYDELHGMARAQRFKWRGDNTLNTTALVHEAYLKLVNQERAEWKDQAHFMAVAATAMRHILVNYAQRRKAQKRGGGVPDLSLDDANPVSEEAADEVLALHEALERLSGMSTRQTQVVEARFFGGLSIEETAKVLDVSVSTVKRDWTVASAWLHQEIRKALE
jgi:RNA polymerase sigma factor (TIGR02999 family)